MRGCYGKNEEQRVTPYCLHEEERKRRVGEKANRINESTGISRPQPGINAHGNFGHGGNSPHGFLDESYLTSGTYIFSHWSIALLTWHLVRSSDRNRPGDPGGDVRSSVSVFSCGGGWVGNARA